MNAIQALSQLSYTPTSEEIIQFSCAIHAASVSGVFSGKPALPAELYPHIRGNYSVLRAIHSVDFYGSSIIITEAIMSVNP